MATKSIMKKINIKSRKQGAQFAEALERATQYRDVMPKERRSCKEISKDKLKEFFG